RRRLSTIRTRPVRPPASPPPRRPSPHAHVLPLHCVLDYWSSARCLAVLPPGLGCVWSVGRPEPGAHSDRHRPAFRLATDGSRVSARAGSHTDSNLISGG